MDEQPSMCPRCDSTNTKFCYYNNYTKSQPRYFCRSCKKHWTKGGTLRNVTKRKKVAKTKTSSKSKNKKVGPTCKSGVGCSDVDEGLRQQMDDTQLVVHQKDESFGGISTGFDQGHVLFDNLGCGDVVGLRDGDNMLGCSSFDHKMFFSFESPQVSELMERTHKDAVADQLPCFPDHADMDLKWEDVLEITQQP